METVYNFLKDDKEMKVPIKSWVTDIEEGALDQAKNLAKLPFIYKHVALMPDCHQGYGMPIGGVIATKGVVIPNAVGVDIGCGMCATKTNYQDFSSETLKQIMGLIRERIPVGFNHHKEKQIGLNYNTSINLINEITEEATYQIGTLGGGNHFIEIQKDNDGFIWFMIHSGSRNFGYKIAKHYNKLAQELCLKWHSNIPQFKGEDGLSFLPIDTDEGKEYIEAMNIALDFAKLNRSIMSNTIKAIFYNTFNSVTFDETINIHHNYTTMENHFGKNVMVHRKGATSAKDGQLGIIPGSQGTRSYIVRGLGNPESFMSCSHGAGRVMGRKEAQRKLSLEEEIKKMDEQGIIHGIRNQSDLDEASGAYKDIDVVMENQKDLVEIVTELKPLAVIKG